MLFARGIFIYSVIQLLSSLCLQLRHVSYIACNDLIVKAMAGLCISNVARSTKIFHFLQTTSHPIR